MKYVILMGSPRLNGNTAELCKPFMEELRSHSAEVQYITLADKKIAPCLGCYACQDIEGEYGCIQKDDMHAIADAIIWSDYIILATPIYTWYCTAEMKAVLDRHFAFNKYYRSAKGSLWAGRKVALLLTHGYAADYAAEPFITGMKRLCEHSNLEFSGVYSARDIDDLVSFQTEEVRNGARDFARSLL